jgi:hypothetical protein
MRNIQKIVTFFSVLLILTGCKETKEPSKLIENAGWKKDTQVFKTIKNVNFNFPDSGFAFNNKEDLIKESFDALKIDSQLIGLKEFYDTIFIRFLRSRIDMFPLTATKASGNAYPHISTLYVVANENQKPPIKHELMHLIAMLKWDYPTGTSTWMNEGLATYAENNCSGFNVAELYRYFMENDKLISMDLLASDFYKQPEMIAYHQSAYIVEYLLSNYTIDQFKQLWIGGFEKFEEIYGVPYTTVKIDLENKIMEKYLTVPKIDFEKFKKGCE